MKKVFLVGRVTPRSTEVFLAESARAPAPFPGPWTLKALVHLPESERPEGTGLENRTVH
jgi:hypothetical protein